MLILYILSVLSFLALLWATIAMARHIRRSAVPSSDPAATKAPSHPLAAASSRRIPPKSVPSGSLQSSIPSKNVA